jgi:hypothetical protein
VIGAVAKRIPQRKRDPIGELEAVRETGELAKTVADGIRAERKAGLPYVPPRRYPDGSLPTRLGKPRSSRRAH